jgi:capsular polysaccharide export protein
MTPNPIACLTGLSPWKRRPIRAMLGPDLPYRTGAAAAVQAAQRRGGGVAGWATRLPPSLAQHAAAAGVAVWRIEDGFIRSSGLGAGLVPPASIVADSRGLYYDPGTPSDLEHILQTEDFSPDLIARAKRLASLIIARGITKYNLGGKAIDLPAGRRVVLVPGQVSDDRSVTLGGAGITDMADLLARVRALEPDAYILFKPHPDVDAGLRRGAIPDAVALGFADGIVRGTALAPLLGRVDAVHTLTSLTGFEALLRGRDVICHGQPFYAGWGLTADLAPVMRRTRRRSLAELVAASLIRYPRYFDAATGAACTPEQLVTRLTQMPAPHGRLRLALAKLNAQACRP